MTQRLSDFAVYMVGGAVRDALLGLPVKDRDWVVVGATPGQMEALDFKRVGRDFPVFLHPETHEEYALARTERKTGPGYAGFEFDTSPDISLEQDLRRRDLTINAIARDGDGNIIDPFNGVEDLKNGVLRHVSPAFAEDPVRILRVARLRARFGFRVAEETMRLMAHIVAGGEVDALVAERVWQELRGALEADTPSLFIRTLRECGALARIFPEIHSLFGVPQNVKYHPEVDTGIHTLMVIDQAAALTADPKIRFAALVHDLGKALSPAEQLPSHKGHEVRGLAVIDGMCDRLRVPNEYRALARLVCRHHLQMHRLYELRPSRIVRLLENLDAFRRPERLRDFAIACEADKRGRAGLQDKPYPQGARLLACHAAAMTINSAQAAEKFTDGAKIAEEIRRLRCEAVKNLTANLPPHG